tara:strand:+ start:2654 stop:2836 length:183 start_codon:yes stop_codon:yes gene_type:complete
MDNNNMNKIKTHTADRKKVTITKTINGQVEKRTYKGVTINNIPDEYNHWFNYKGLTFVIS